MEKRTFLRLAGMGFLALKWVLTQKITQNDILGDNHLGKGNFFLWTTFSGRGQNMVRVQKSYPSNICPELQLVFCIVHNRHLNLHSICVKRHIKGEQKQLQNKNYCRKARNQLKTTFLSSIGPVNAPLKLWWWQQGNRILSAKQTEIRTPQIKTTGSYQLNRQASERGESSDKFISR